MSKDRPHIDYLQTGPFPYYIGITMDPAAFKRELKRLGLKRDYALLGREHADATTHHLVKDGTGVSIIAMAMPSRRHGKDQYAALLAHEAVHVIQEMTTALGPLGCEAEAYLVQMIVQEGLQRAWRTGKVRRTEPRA